MTSGTVEPLRHAAASRCQATVGCCSRRRRRDDLMAYRIATSSLQRDVDLVARALDELPRTHATPSRRDAWRGRGAPDEQVRRVNHATYSVKINVMTLSVDLRRRLARRLFVIMPTDRVPELALLISTAHRIDSA